MNIKKLPSTASGLFLFHQEAPRKDTTVNWIKTMEVVLLYISEKGQSKIKNIFVVLFHLMLHQTA